MPPGSSIRFTVRVSIFVLTLPITWRICWRAVSRAKTSLSDYIITTNNIRLLTVRGSRSLNKDKYYYMGDADLTSAALLLDVSSYYTGLVRRVYCDPESAFLTLPFTGKGGRFARNVMNFYNRRLVALANRRWATGYYGKRNAGWRELYDGFVPDIRIRKQLRRGLLRWWKCELINLGLMLRRRAAVSAKQTSATIPTQAW